MRVPAGSSGDDVGRFEFDQGKRQDVGIAVDCNFKEVRDPAWANLHGCSRVDLIHSPTLPKGQKLFVFFGHVEAKQESSHNRITRSGGI